MDNLKLGALTVVSSSLLLTSPALAEGPKLQLAPTSDWKVSKKSDRCRLSRRFGEADNATTLIFERGARGWRFNLTVIGRPVQNPVGQLVSLQFGPDEMPIGRPYITVKAKSGRSALVMYGADFSPAMPVDDGKFEVDRADSARLAAIQYLQIERASLTPFRLKTGPMDEALAALSACQDALWKDLVAAGAGNLRDPIALSERQNWVLPGDYPRIMSGYRQEGRVGFTLYINAQGKPGLCTIYEATVPQMFDNAVCLALLKRARFEPALDSNGDPTTSYYSSSVRFRIP